MNFICIKHKFVQTILKNRILISFFINLLVGILFSFPVFSAQSNASVSYQIQSEFFVEEEIILSNDFQIVGNTAIDYSKDLPVNISRNKIIKRNLISGNKENTKNSSPPNPVYFNILISSSTYINLNSTFVNLSFLKELRTTKMLC